MLLAAREASFRASPCARAITGAARRRSQIEKRVQARRVLENNEEKT
jgi:hypothetical protein